MTQETQGPRVEAAAARDADDFGDDRQPEIIADSDDIQAEWVQFDWAMTASVVLHEQPQIAVYESDSGHVVVRREQSSNEDNDAVIIIAPENAVAICDAILAAAGIAEQPGDRTATERQRRRRARLRDRRDRHAARDTLDFDDGGSRLSS
jgi:hypothetical protein